MLFDGYLIVDWSANSTPKTGKDSIWWCHMAWEEGSLIVNDNNPSTRKLAFKQIKKILTEYACLGRSVLVGFDFAYGYPQNFARSITPAKEVSWHTVWHRLSKVIEDNDANQNNRFAVAANLNHSFSGQAGPFWGCPERHCTEFLSKRKPNQDANLFSEFRIAEQGTSAHSVWKLAYPGAVGSQVLMGLPYLNALRNDPELQAVSSVWPFETGLKELEQNDLSQRRIIHAEIYPSLVKIPPQENGIKDQLQVNALAQHFADLDFQQQLGKLFAGKRQLNQSEKQIIENEEGWILGV